MDSSHRPTSPIAAVLFDYDGVLTTDRTGSLTTCRYLSRVIGIPLERLRAVFGKYNEELLLGRTTHERIWDALCRDLEQRIDPAVLIPAFESTPPNEPMFHLARRLKCVCRTAIVTDNKLDRIRTLTRAQRLDDWFDAIVVSAEIGSGKDHPRIFEAAMERLGVSAGECIFIDNQEKNLIVPRQLGMLTIHHDDAVNDISRLERRLMECGLRGIGD